MKFIADVMLGRLAKRLRLLGWDVLYDPGLDDNEIIRLSLQQDRVILTRDTALAARPLAKNNLFLKNDLVRKQVDEVLTAFPGKTAPLTRCSLCNVPLVPAPQQDVRDLVPNHVFETHDAFLRCPTCARIYWRGTHVRRMEITGDAG